MSIFVDITQRIKKKFIEVEIVDDFDDNDVILDIRSIDEWHNKPLKISGREVISLPFYNLSNKFKELDQSKTWLLWCERGIMSQLQALYLHERGFYNVKVLRPLVIKKSTT